MLPVRPSYRIDESDADSGSTALRVVERFRPEESTSEEHDGTELVSPHDRGSSSLDAVYRAHAAAVARWAARLGGPGVDLEDVVHDVFLVVQRRLPEFRGDAKLTTWLYRITVRVVHRHRRRAKWRRLLPWSAEREHTVPDDRPDPEAALDAGYAERLVYSALEGLREEYRTALVLFEIEGQSGEEVAAVLGVRVETVWVWLHRARRHFTRRVHELERDAPRRAR